MTQTPSITLDDEWAVGGRNYRIRSIVLFTVYGLYAALVLVTTGMFILQSRNQYSDLSKRSVKLVTIQATGCFIVGTLGLVATALNDWPCFIKLWLLDIGFILALSALGGRAMQLYIVGKVHTLNSQIRRSDPMVPQLLHASVSNVSILTKSTAMSTTFDESGRNMLMTFSNRPATNRSAQNKDSTHAQLQKYTRMQRMVTDTRLVVYCLISIVFAIVLTLIINIVNKDYSLRPISTHCPFVWGFLPTSGIISVFLFVAYPVLLAKVWKTQDVLGIRSDLIICETVGTVSMIVTVVWELALDDIRQHWSGLFFIWIGAFLIHNSSVAVPLFRSIKHTRSVYRQLHRPGTSSSNTAMMNPYTGSEHGAVRVRRDEFNMMLGNAYEYSRFRKYAASCFCSELAALLDEYQALKASAVLAFGSLSEENSSVPATPTSMTSRTSESIQPNEFLHNHGLTLQKYVVAPHTPHTMAPGLDYANASGVHTSITVSILDTIKSAYPNRGINERTQFPASLKDKILSVFAIYINSKSYMAVNVPQSMVRKIEDHLRADEITLAILDEVKDEVLFMLYADVYTRFRAEKQ